MIKYSIVLVPFPFDDFSTSKVRPAICLTSELGQFNHIIIAFISSRIPDDLMESDIVIKTNTDNSTGTGLTVDSVLRLHKIVTIQKSIIKRRLGSINPTVKTEISKKLKKLFELKFELK